MYSEKFFKNSTQLLTNPFLVMLQTFFYLKSTQTKIGHSKSTPRAVGHSSTRRVFRNLNT